MPAPTGCDEPVTPISGTARLESPKALAAKGVTEENGEEKEMATPTGFEPAQVGGQDGDAVGRKLAQNGANKRDCEDSSPQIGSKLERSENTLDEKICSGFVPDLDPELARLIERWAYLPEHIRAAVLALVDSSSVRESGD